jgi:aspartate aminotransferase
MFTKLSDRLNYLSESQTLAMARKTRELREQGHEVIGLSLGEPDFNTPHFIKEAAKSAIDNNFSHYTAVQGDKSLLEAISRKFKRDNDLDYNLNQIVASTGAKQSLINALLSLVNPGDEVLILAPYWVSYVEMVKMAEGTPVILSAGVEQDYKVNASQLRGALTDKTRVLMFSSPCNPTGSVFSSEELLAMAEVLNDFPNVVVISDEIYELINFVGKHVSFASLPGMYERTVTINGMSKGFAMTGWRLGYIGAPEWIAKACTKIQGQFTSAPTGITQMAAKAALEVDPEELHGMRDTFLKRRDLLLDLLSGIPGMKCNVPQGAFYVFPDISFYFGKKAKGKTINTADDFCMYMLHEAHVALVPGDAFGADNCVRISYSTSEANIIEAAVRMKKALNDFE